MSFVVASFQFGLASLSFECHISIVNLSISISKGLYKVVFNLDVESVVSLLFNFNPNLILCIFIVCSTNSSTFLDTISFCTIISSFCFSPDGEYNISITVPFVLLFILSIFLIPSCAFSSFS